MSAVSEGAGKGRVRLGRGCLTGVKCGVKEAWKVCWTGKALRSSDSVSSPGNGSRACAECSVQCGREEVPGVGGRQPERGGSISWGRGSEQVCWDPAGAHVGDRRVYRRRGRGLPWRSSGERLANSPAGDTVSIPGWGTKIPRPTSCTAWPK